MLKTTMLKTIYKETNEDWYPSLIVNWKNIKLLRVHFMQLSTKQWRVCVWGGDDFGMERDYPENKRDLALECFEDIAKLEQPLTRFILKSFGFKNA